jgi:membrane-associated phospholipid phosphatase
MHRRRDRLRTGSPTAVLRESMRRRTRRRELAATALAAASVTAVRARQRLGLPPAVTAAVAVSAPLVVARGFPRSPRRDAIVWAAHMWAYKNLFELPNDNPDRLRRRAHFDYPIWVDEHIGGGVPPTRRLQRALRTRGELSTLDKALSLLYWTWEPEPHLALAWIRWRHPGAFAAAAGRLAATFDLTLIGYWLVPSAPPWWVSEKTGRMGGEVRRVMSEVASWLKREPNPTEGDHEMGANPLAAMPSDHLASAAMTAMLLSEQDPRIGAVAWCYALLLGFTLVYLGEHYVVDLLAGLALAAAVGRARVPLAATARRLLGS